MRLWNTVSETTGAGICSADRGKTPDAVLHKSAHCTVRGASPCVYFAKRGAYDEPIGADAGSLPERAPTRMTRVGARGEAADYLAAAAAGIAGAAGAVAAGATFSAGLLECCALLWALAAL